MWSLGELGRHGIDPGHRKGHDSEEQKKEERKTEVKCEQERGRRRRGRTSRCPPGCLRRWVSPQLEGRTVDLGRELTLEEWLM